MKNKQIVVYGGCFNPPLNSHFSLAEQLLNEYNQIEKVLFMPVNSKYEKIGLIDNEHRYNMLKMVCDKNEKFEVSRIELDKPKQLYTVETLKEVHKIYPDYEIAFIMGSDNLKEISTWIGVDELVNNFKTYIFERDKDNIEEIIQSNKFLNEKQTSFIKVKNNITSNLSSTFVRNKIKNNKSIKYLAPEEVINYIIQNNLYK